MDRARSSGDSWKKRSVSRRGRSKHPSPSRRFELRLYRAGVTLVAGADEVGRGCLAGPVLAAAVILPENANTLRTITGVRDSKVLTAHERLRLYERIIRIAPFGLGIISHRFIDRYGIAPASRMATAKAIGRLSPWPQHVLLDAFPVPIVGCDQTPIIDGDALCLSIAAASIVAKVTRDRLMVLAGRKYPGYGFENHKGYGTPEHHEALLKLGPCPIHRLTFRPAFARCSIADLGANREAISLISQPSPGTPRPAEGSNAASAVTLLDIVAVAEP